MDKGTKKTKKFNYNPQIIERLVDKYGMTSYYIKQCAAGRRDGIVPDKIRKEYKLLASAADKAVESQIHNI